MAKVDTQNIPSEDRINYKRACQISTTTRNIKYVRGRFPWRLPQMQKGGRGVSPGQKEQRGKFIHVKDKYALLSPSEKERWKDANPEYKSYLFGYNFFMLEGLMGGGTLEYPQMIKSIQVIKESVPTTGTKSFAITTVDPAKTVVMIQGNSYIADRIQHHAGENPYNTVVQVNLSPNIDPAIAEIVLTGTGWYMTMWEGEGEGYGGAWAVTEVTASYVKIKLRMAFGTGSYGWSMDVIEHKSQTVYPVLVSVGANAVVMDWALVPSVAADVSITVVEYL